MKRILLQPEQIVTLAEQERLGDTIFHLFFRIYQQGSGELLPPSVVFSSDLTGPAVRDRQMRACIRAERRRTGVRPLYTQSIEEITASYAKLERMLKTDTANGFFYLSDSGTRAIAATLARAPIPCLEVQTTADLRTISKMETSNELFRYGRSDGSARELAAEFERGLTMLPAHCMTMRERVDTLVANNDVPGYMKMAYLKK